MKKLVTIGDSHTMGVFHGDIGNNLKEVQRCHDRSWSRKLFKLGNFDQEYNLAVTGGSNNRSVRVLMNWIKTNYQDSFVDPDLVIIISLTGPSRFEIPVNTERYINLNFPNVMTLYDRLSDSTLIRKAGIWDLEPLAPLNKNYLEYVKLHYENFESDEYSRLLMYNQVVLLHHFLKSYGIKHYFFHGISSPEDFNNIEFNFVDLPFIKFYIPTKPHLEIPAFSAEGWLKRLGFKVGHEIDTTSSCHHFDHDANQALAEYIYSKIKDHIT